MSSVIKVATTFGGLTSLDLLSTPVKDPGKVTFYPYTNQKRTGAGSSVAQGSPYAILTWRNIKRPQRDQLRALVTTNPSTVLYWQLPTNDGNLTTAIYTANTTWPLVENYYFDLLTDFTLTLYNLVVASS